MQQMSVQSPLEQRLRFAVILTGLVLAGELVGGILANSLALLSDAGHVFTDVLALSLSWFGVRQARRPATSRMTYGYHRIGILISLINALSIIAISGVIFYQAYLRLQQPQPVHSVLMFSVAVVGLVANSIVVLKLHSDQRRNLNVRSAFLHAWGDALASVGVIFGGVVIYLTDWFWLDPVISMFIALIIVFAAWRIIKEGLGIFLEASPGDLDIDALIEVMSGVPGVKNIHDLHVWSIAPGMHTLSCHVLVDDLPVSEGASILEKLNEVLSKQFDIGHTTLQIECATCGPDTLYCLLVSEKEGGQQPGR